MVTGGWQASLLCSQSGNGGGKDWKIKRNVWSAMV